MGGQWVSIVLAVSAGAAMGFSRGIEAEGSEYTARLQALDRNPVK